jgi:hypothetical protein
MSKPLRHLDSRYSRLSADAIAFTLETVRDANEVLYGSDDLDARSMIFVARSVFETERLFELGPHSFARTDGGLPHGNHLAGGRSRRT